MPLYAVETVRMLLDRGLLVQRGSSYVPAGPIETLEMPETLHALIAARLDGLAGDERRLLQAAAVLGKTFTVEALATLTGRAAGGDRADAGRARAQGGAVALGRSALAGARPVRLPAGPGAAGGLRDALQARAARQAPGRGSDGRGRGRAGRGRRRPLPGGARGPTRTPPTPTRSPAGRSRRCARPGSGRRRSRRRSRRSATTSRPRTSPPSRSSRPICSSTPA